MEKCFYLLFSYNEITDKNAIYVANSFIIISIRKSGFLDHNLYETLKYFGKLTEDEKAIVEESLNRIRDFYVKKYDEIREKIKKLFNIKNNDIVSGLFNYIKPIVKDKLKDIKKELNNLANKEAEEDIYNFLVECENFYEHGDKLGSYTDIYEILDNLHKNYYVNIIKNTSTKFIKQKIRELRLAIVVYGLLLGRIKMRECKSRNSKELNIIKN